MPIPRNFRFGIVCTAIAGILSLSAVTTFAKDSADNFGFFRYPATDGNWVVFTSEGDLWRAPIKGGEAFRLTTHEGDERFAHISPDGNWICYSMQEDGQDDVFLISSSGGEARRLTFHPDGDQALGWDNDGNVIFRSTREIPYRGYRIYRIPQEGGWPVALELDKASLISFEPNGSRVAFNRYSREFRTWKRYKGGWAQDIWVGDIGKMQFLNLTDQADINDWDGTDAFPMWHTDGRIYFLSDREGRSNIYSMLPDGRDVKRHTDHSDFDVRWPSLGNGVIVYQHGMDIWAYDIASDNTRIVPITLPSDRIQARQSFPNPVEYVSDYDLAPDAKRVLFTSRGELFTAPSKGEGLIRRLTFTSGIRDKFAQWSPDGKTIAAWNDKTGEEELYLYPAEGGEPKRLGTDGRGWHYPAVWSPDGKRLLFSNEELELMVMDAATGKSQVIDHSDWEIREYVWSPDSRWVAYARYEPNSNQTIQLWDSQTNQVTAVTDDFFNSHGPAWDPEGNYLFILSDRYANPHLDGMEMTYILDRRTQPFAVCLRKDVTSPFAVTADPESDEDEEWGDNGDKSGKKGKDKGKKDEEQPEPVKPIDIDLDGLSERVTLFPVEPGNYFGLQAAKNKVFFMSRENRGMLGRPLFEDDPPWGFKLHKFNLKKKKLSEVADGIRSFLISRDGKKMLIQERNKFKVTGIDDQGGWGKGKFKGGDDEEEDKGKEYVDLSKWDMLVDQRAEWKQIFFEAWRLQRDFFWDPNMHGVNWKGIRDQYAPLAERISTRDELNDLIGEMMAELNCSHTYVWGGGDTRGAEYKGTGLLGIDVTRLESGFYLIDHIYGGRYWEKNGASPFAEPGMGVSEGEYLVAINGRSCALVQNYLELLRDKAGKITSVTVNSKPSLDGGREVVLKPLGNERRLRYEDWVDGRRAYVEAKTDGALGYIHLTNMGGMGLSQFTGDYLPQFDRQGMIMDVRYNGGGFVAPMILQHLARKPFTFGRARHGFVKTYRSPQTAFHGYMAAVCNGETGSDGETFTEGFKRLGLGPVIGTRTWGGWVGIRGDKEFIDRGMTTQPEFTGWGLDGTWLIEGHGTEPDIEVKEDPAAIMRGEDPQLDRTIAELMAKIKANPPVVTPAPPYPDRSLKQ